MFTNHQLSTTDLIKTTFTEKVKSSLWGSLIVTTIVLSSALEHVQAKNIESSIKEKIDEKFELVSANLGDLRNNISTFIMFQSKKDSEQDEKIKKLEEKNNKQDEEIIRLKENEKKKKEDEKKQGKPDEVKS